MVLSKIITYSPSQAKKKLNPQINVDDKSALQYISENKSILKDANLDFSKNVMSLKAPVVNEYVISKTFSLNKHSEAVIVIYEINLGVEKRFSTISFDETTNFDKSRTHLYATNKVWLKPTVIESPSLSPLGLKEDPLYVTLKEAFIDKFSFYTLPFITFLIELSKINEEICLFVIQRPLLFCLGAKGLFHFYAYLSSKGGCLYLLEQIRLKIRVESPLLCFVRFFESSRSQFFLN